MPHFSAVYGSSLKTENERNKSDDKAVALHRYSSFYFVFDILERQKSFQIGSIVVPKDVLEPFKPDTIRKYDSEEMGKFVQFLKNIHKLYSNDENSLSDFGKSVKPYANQLAEFMNLTNVSYQSLLDEGIGSIRKTNDFDRKGHKIESSSFAP